VVGKENRYELNEYDPAAADAAQAGETAEERNERMDPEKDRGSGGAKEPEESALDYIIKLRERFIKAVGIPKEIAESKSEPHPSRRHLQSFTGFVFAAPSRLRSLRETPDGGETAAGYGSSPQAGARPVLPRD
jgi:hypothetical protein